MGVFVPYDQLKSRLVEEGLITPELFEAYREEADRKNQSLVDILVSQQVADSYYIYTVVAQALGVDMVSLGERKLDPDIVRLLPEEIARQRGAIIFDREADGTLDVAMLDPSNLETIEFLSQRLKARVKPFLSTMDELNRGFSIYGSRSTEDFKHIIEENIQESLRTQSRSSEEAATQLPIVAIVDNVLSYAVSLRASDIHIEILDEATLIRYRIDGILYEIIRIPKVVHPALVARFKILAGLKIDEHYRPQDGRFRYQIVNQAVDVRVSIMPTYYGEKVEMRLLEATQKPMALEEIGMLDDMVAIVREAIKKTFGMIVVCGPTGSGKTTTLYALMNIINKPTVNICSVEDPIEYNMRYVNQSQINTQAGITFASGLRALLRQDPNIIMVGEIRDKETAGIAVQAALTGHLLLSSLHTNDAPTAIPRLFDLDVQPFLVASTLSVVIAQRLVRRVCSSCIYSYKIDEETNRIITAQLQDLHVPISNAIMPNTLFKGKGCAMCGGLGHRGRLGIFETIDISDEVRRIITSERFSLDAIVAAARAQGMRTMFEDGLEKVQLGMTTIDEVLRVVKE